MWLRYVCRHLAGAPHDDDSSIPATRSVQRHEERAAHVQDMGTNVAACMAGLPACVRACVRACLRPHRHSLLHPLLLEEVVPKVEIMQALQLHACMSGWNT